MNKLIVSNLSDNIDEDELTKMFEDYSLKAVDLKPGRYAVLTFEDELGAMDAEEHWCGSFVYDRKLHIKFARW